jgi:methylated-DNA-[protein]-cysteine S-methyltransferase
MEHAVLDTPIGPVHVTIDAGAVIGLKFEPSAGARRTDPVGAVDALTAYFAGELDALDALPIRSAGTAFQEHVWKVLRTIPPGETVSYAEVAAEVGKPRAVRAVGRANATNPIGIIVPCHRIIRSDGTLGGYGGGLDRKRWLLDHERRADVGSA